MPTAARLGDQAWWTRHARPFVRAEHLQTEVQAVLEKLDQVCDAILVLRPGEAFGDAHGLDSVVDTLLASAPVTPDILQSG